MGNKGERDSRLRTDRIACLAVSGWMRDRWGWAVCVQNAAFLELHLLEPIRMAEFACCGSPLCGISDSLLVLLRNGSNDSTQADRLIDYALRLFAED